MIASRLRALCHRLQACLRGAGLGTGREVDEEVGRQRSRRSEPIRVLGYSFLALIVARFGKQSTMKRRSSDAGLQA
jgi:hypothetical protein